MAAVTKNAMMWEWTPPLATHWANGNQPHRLVISETKEGSTTKTMFLIEVKETDLMGDSKWTKVWDHTPGGGSQYLDKILQLVGQLVLATDPKLEAAFRLAGWTGVSDLLRTGMTPEEKAAYEKEAREKRIKEGHHRYGAGPIALPPPTAIITDVG